MTEVTEKKITPIPQCEQLNYTDMAQLVAINTNKIYETYPMKDYAFQPLLMFIDYSNTTSRVVSCTLSAVAMRSES